MIPKTKSYIYRNGAFEEMPTALAEQIKFTQNYRGVSVLPSLLSKTRHAGSGSR